MSVFFTADTHFGDHRTINIWRRPFTGTAEMDELIIARWNNVVAPATVTAPGRCRPPRCGRAGLLVRLNGAKHLVRGNNDPDATVAADGWASVHQYAEAELDGRKLVLCHYPFRSWNGQHRGAINLHGHSHGRLKPMPRQFDVGVDVHEYAPVTLAQLLAPRDEAKSASA